MKYRGCSRLVLGTGKNNPGLGPKRLFVGLKDSGLVGGGKGFVSSPNMEEETRLARKKS